MPPFQKQVKARFDQINNPMVARKDGSVVVKESYFYTCGKTAEDWAQVVKERCEKAGLKVNVRGENHYADWPKSSYWWAVVTPAQ